MHFFTPILYQNYDFAFVFLLCKFTPVISKRSTSLPLLHHPPLMVLNFIYKDRNAHVILPLFVMHICDFTPDLELDIYIVRRQN